MSDSLFQKPKLKVNEKYKKSSFSFQEASQVESVFNKIREAVHKNGIRTTEFFKDHDKLRSGIITKNQASLHY